MAKVQYIKRARASMRIRACRTCGHVVQAGKPCKKNIEACPAAPSGVDYLRTLDRRRRRTHRYVA